MENLRVKRQLDKQLNKYGLKLYDEVEQNDLVFKFNEGRLDEVKQLQKNEEGVKSIIKKSWNNSKTYTKTDQYISDGLDWRTEEYEEEFGKEPSGDVLEDWIEREIECITEWFMDMEFNSFVGELNLEGYIKTEFSIKVKSIEVEEFGGLEVQLEMEDVLGEKDRGRLNNGEGGVRECFSVQCFMEERFKDSVVDVEAWRNKYILIEENKVSRISLQDFLRRENKEYNKFIEDMNELINTNFRYHQELAVLRLQEEGVNILCV